MTLGLYVHIPFCHARCGYCDFVTFTGKDDRRDAYVADLCKELEMHAFLEISTIFLGGGTPSVLEPRHIRRLFDKIQSQFQIDPDAEITLEANPESISREKLGAWRAAGINRLSIGLQAYDNALLKTMGRLHTADQFSAAYALARASGFSNINIDLIYGFPGQSLEAWIQSLEATLRHDPDHLSMYSLTVEDHTPFAAEGHQIDADLQAEMYGRARESLRTAGYHQYEISNFSRPGKECRHNMIYWRGQDYLGLGVGAVGTVDGKRWQNVKSLDAYARALDERQWPRVSTESLSPRDRRFERLMLGLRLREGFPWSTEENPQWLEERARLAEKGWLQQIRPDVWRIPDPYVALTNQILLAFV